MKDTIICFSGTGNSYYVAKQIAKSQNHDNIIMINEINESFELPERLGFIFPVYISREPIFIEKKLREILSKITVFTKIQYVYLITTAGSNNPGWTHIRFEKILKDFGVATTYVNNVKMPNNLIKIKDIEESKVIYKTADLKINTIINELKEEKIKFPKFKLFTHSFSNITYLFNKYYTKHFSENFIVTSDCTSCKLCYQSCPSNNIKMQDGKPIFLDNCFACNACISNCPEEAIIKPKGKNIKYKNPNGYFYHKYRS